MIGLFLFHIIMHLFKCAIYTSGRVLLPHAFAVVASRVASGKKEAMNVCTHIAPMTTRRPKVYDRIERRTRLSNESTLRLTDGRRQRVLCQPTYPARTVLVSKIMLVHAMFHLFSGPTRTNRETERISESQLMIIIPLVVGLLCACGLHERGKHGKTNGSTGRSHDTKPNTRTRLYTHAHSTAHLTQNTLGSDGLNAGRCVLYGQQVRLAMHGLQFRIDQSGERNHFLLSHKRRFKRCAREILNVKHNHLNGRRRFTYIRLQIGPSASHLSTFRCRLGFFDGICVRRVCLWSCVRR